MANQEGSFVPPRCEDRNDAGGNSGCPVGWLNLQPRGRSWLYRGSLSLEISSQVSERLPASALVRLGLLSFRSHLGCEKRSAAQHPNGLLSVWTQQRNVNRFKSKWNPFFYYSPKIKKKDAPWGGGDISSVGMCTVITVFRLWGFLRPFLVCSPWRFSYKV